MREPIYCEWAGCVCVVCCQIEGACIDCDLRLEGMKAFLKEKDPRFATDEYLNGLSYEELLEYYTGCLETVRSAERDSKDDWCERLEHIRVNNI